MPGRPPLPLPGPALSRPSAASHLHAVLNALPGTLTGPAVIARDSGELAGLGHATGAGGEATADAEMSTLISYARCD